MPTTKPLNYAATTLAADYTAGSGTLVLKTGSGSLFGSPTVDAPIRITVADRGTLVGGQIVAGTKNTIYTVTSRSGDTLSGLTAVEGTTDQNFTRNDPVASLITAGTLEEIQGIAAEGGANNVKLTGAQEIAGVKTFIDPPLIVGAAAGIGGDRLNLQTAAGVDIRRYDQNGTAHHYIGAASNPSNVYHQFHFLNTDASRPGITFNINGSSHLNMSGTTYNNVTGMGPNDNGGVPLIAGHYLFRDGWEDNWESAPGVFQAERHVGALYNPDTGQEIRPYTAAVVTSSYPMRAQVSFESSYLNQVVEVDRTSLMSSILSGDDYNFYTVAFSAYQNIPLLLNQTSFGKNGLDTSLKVNGRTARETFQINGVNKWSLVSHSDNNFYINNGSEINAAQFNQTSLEARFGGSIFGAPGGATPRVVRMANTTATGGDGDFAFVVGGSGSGIDGELRLVHVPTSTILHRWTKVGQSFNSSAPVAFKPAITGSRGGNAALASLITTLATLGLVTDSSTA